MLTHTLCIWLVLAFIPMQCGRPGPTPVSAPDLAVSAFTQLENGSLETVLNGFQIHYEVHGEGPALMTLPSSWGLSLQGVRALYRPLEAHLTLVYFDPRGMGDSGDIREPSDMGMAAVRADFDALRAHLGIERADVIGWSNGAMNPIYLAVEEPERFVEVIRAFLEGP